MTIKRAKDGSISVTIKDAELVSLSTVAAVDKYVREKLQAAGIPTGQYSYSPSRAGKLTTEISASKKSTVYKWSPVK